MTNPADPLYQHRKRFGTVAVTAAAVARIGSESTPGTIPEDGAPGIDSVFVDPDNPNFVIYNSASLTGSERFVNLPVSSLLIRDPTNPNFAIFPTLST